MANVRFYLDKPLSDGQSYIMAYFTFDGERVRIPTGEKILSKNWDQERQLAKRSAIGSLEINALIQKMETDLLRIYRSAKIDDVKPTPAYIKEQYKKGANPTAVKVKGFFEYFDEFIDSAKTTKQNGTIQIYKAVKNHLTQFAKSQKIKLDFEKFDHSLYEKLIHYLITEAKLNNNSTGKIVKNLRVFLNWARKKDLHNNDDFKEYKVFNEEADNIALTMEQVRIIQDLDLEGNKKLSKVRDLFLLQCFTGLRFSDICQLRSEHIQGDFIKLRMQKTKFFIQAPMIPETRQILKRYPDGLPTISNQKMNQYLTELAKLADLKDNIEVVTYKGAERIVEIHPLHDLITTHTGRRTFITLSLENGASYKAIMDATGIRDIKTLMKYVKVTEKITQREITTAWSKLSKTAEKTT